MIKIPKYLNLVTRTIRSARVAYNVSIIRVHHHVACIEEADVLGPDPD